MRTPSDVAATILDASVFSSEKIDKYGNWSEIPKDVAKRLSARIAEEGERAIAEYAKEIANTFSFYPSKNGRNLIDFKLPDEPIKLAFDPSTPVVRTGMSKDDYQSAVAVRRIFKDRVSRNLWLGIKPGHLTSQHFVPDIIRIAKLVKSTKPSCWHGLFNLMSGNDPIFDSFRNSLRIREMAILLFPYVNGDRDFKYIADVPPKSAQ